MVVSDSQGHRITPTVSRPALPGLALYWKFIDMPRQMILVDLAIRFRRGVGDFMVLIKGNLHIVLVSCNACFALILGVYNRYDRPSHRHVPRMPAPAADLTERCIGSRLWWLIVNCIVMTTIAVSSGCDMANYATGTRSGGALIAGSWTFSVESSGSDLRRVALTGFGQCDDGLGLFFVSLTCFKKASNPGSITLRVWINERLSESLVEFPKLSVDQFEYEPVSVERHSDESRPHTFVYDIGLVGLDDPCFAREISASVKGSSLDRNFSIMIPNDSLRSFLCLERLL
jgi:hypothetical protein